MSVPAGMFEELNATYFPDPNVLIIGRCNCSPPQDAWIEVAKLPDVVFSCPRARQHCWSHATLHPRLQALLKGRPRKSRFTDIILQWDQARRDPHENDNEGSLTQSRPSQRSMATAPGAWPDSESHGGKSESSDNSSSSIAAKSYRKIQAPVQLIATKLYRKVPVFVQLIVSITVAGYVGSPAVRSAVRFGAGLAGTLFETAASWSENGPVHALMDSVFKAFNDPTNLGHYFSIAIAAARILWQRAPPPQTVRPVTVDLHQQAEDDIAALEEHCAMRRDFLAKAGGSEE